jgi:hypothetical protein
MLPERGKYSKCGDYALVEGFIRPGKGSPVIEYDLWRDYTEAPLVGWSIEVPYRAALDLARRFRETPPVWAEDGSGLILSEAQATELLAFTSRFGLLGLLPGQASHIAVGKVELDRRVGSWFERRARSAAAEIDYLDWGDALWSSPAKRSHAAAGNTLELGRSILPDLPSWLATDNEPAEVALETFFPELAGAADIPLPGSPAFWATYSEPVFLFIEFLWSFLASVDVLRGPAHSHSHLERQSALDFFEVLASGDHASTVIDGAGYSDLHRSPGLISAFAAMYLRDWKSGRRVVYCETCNKVFVTDDSRAKFCSERCRNTMLMRRYRSAKRQTGKD